jgi:hypothetical protein
MSGNLAYQIKDNSTNSAGAIFRVTRFLTQHRLLNLDTAIDQIRPDASRSPLVERTRNGFWRCRSITIGRRRQKNPEAVVKQMRAVKRPIHNANRAIPTIITAAIALTGTHIDGLASARAESSESTTSVVIVDNVRLKRTYHDSMLLPDHEHAGFGSLLYDKNGELVLHDGNKTWLYTTGLFEPPTGGRRDWYGKWISYVRELNVQTFTSGASKIALGLADADRWAVVHDVIEASPRLFVAFYSANGGVRAAVSDKPNGIFKTGHDFKLEVTEPWEKEGGEIDSLESNGAHVLIAETDRFLTLWLGYDSYHVDQTAGQLGWANVRIDKRSGNVELLGKHPRNPLPMLPKHYIAARCGGNLATDIRLGGKYVFFYYSRPSKEKIMLTAALATDPLFQHVTNIVEIEPPLGDEIVIEKFESYMFDNELHIIYENKLASGHWGTGIRVYKIAE